MGWLSGIPVVGDLMDLATSAAGMQGQAHYQRVNMREAADLQHKENVFWAEYNTPAQQMERLKSAGLNPHLVYGDGANAQFQGSVSPSGGMPSAPRTRFGLDYMTYRNMEEQNKNLQAQNKVALETAKKIAEERKGVEFDNRRKAAAVPEYQGWIDSKQQYQTYLNSLDEHERLQAQTWLSNTQSELNQISIDFDAPIKSQILRGYYAENAIKELQQSVTWQNLIADLRKKGAEVTKLQADAAAAVSLAKLYDHTSVKTEAETTGQALENEIKRIKWRLMDAGELPQKINQWLEPLKTILGAGSDASKFFK